MFFLLNLWWGNWQEDSSLSSILLIFIMTYKRRYWPCQRCCQWTDSYAQSAGITTKKIDSFSLLTLPLTFKKTKKKKRRLLDCTFDFQKVRKKRIWCMVEFQSNLYFKDSSQNKLHVYLYMHMYIIINYKPNSPYQFLVYHFSFFRYRNKQFATLLNKFLKV